MTPPSYWLSGRHPNPCPAHKHSFYEVCHAFEGRGHFIAESFGSHQRSITAGDTFIAHPGIAHRYGSHGRDALGICFWAFVIEAMDREDDQGSHFSLALPLAAVADARKSLMASDATTGAVLRLLFLESLSRIPGRTARLQHLLAYLASHVTGLASSPDITLPREAGSTQADGSDQFADAQQFIHDHCHRDVCIKDLASRYRLSVRHTARLFSRRFNTSFAEYLSSVRMQTAAHLLLKESLSLKQVARQCGFSSLPAFVRAFKRATGTTPGEYRHRSLSPGT
ncbi:MAG: helix-turn-helix transcriptional regulator [Planctomycetes bacterium]|nr:helix-turn-helix transcriptional regulator [Planctomycetota bacterium]